MQLKAKYNRADFRLLLQLHALALLAAHEAGDVLGTAYFLQQCYAMRRALVNTERPRLTFKISRVDACLLMEYSGLMAQATSEAGAFVLQQLIDQTDRFLKQPLNIDLTVL